MSSNTTASVAQTPAPATPVDTAPAPPEASPTSPALNIYGALARANELVTAIAKNNVNQGQGFKFRGIDDVYNDLHPILAKCGIFIVPEVVNFEVTERTNNRGGVVRYTMATIRHHFTASDGSSITSTTIGEAMDSGDKGMNKAMSIALKYALFQLFTIPTQDPKDPDAESPQLAPQAPPAPAPAPVDPERQAEVENAINSLADAKTLEELVTIFKALPAQMQGDRSVMGEASRLKAVFLEKKK